MILSDEGVYQVKGTRREIVEDFGEIFNIIYENLGETELKLMIKTALDIVIKENSSETRKQGIKNKRELKNKLKQDLPEELANILCSLL